MIVLEVNKIYCSDCLELMREIPDGSVNMILCDLPYGTTQCKWDVILPFDKLWEQYHRISKNNSAIVLTASQPFTSLLVTSNIKQYKYSWIWRKNKATGHLNAKKQPLREHEDVCVFASTRYYPVMGSGMAYNNHHRAGDSGECYGNVSESVRKNITTRYPRTILDFEVEHNPIHPTQKPVELFEYMIRTYTEKGEVIIDNCCGSGTTAVAAIRTGRRFIGMDISPEYCAIAQKRVDAELAQYKLDL